jgi:hypothetical protein
VFKLGLKLKYLAMPLSVWKMGRYNEVKISAPGLQLCLPYVITRGLKQRLELAGSLRIVIGRMQNFQNV